MDPGTLQGLYKALENETGRIAPPFDLSIEKPRVATQHVFVLVYQQQENSM